MAAHDGVRSQNNDAIAGCVLSFALRFYYVDYYSIIIVIVIMMAVAARAIFICSTVTETTPKSSKTIRGICGTRQAGRQTGKQVGRLATPIQ